MCGFIRRVTDSPAVIELLLDLGIDYLTFNSGDFYPGSQMDILLHNGDHWIADSAKWWFLIDAKTGKPNYQYATFNARNLQGRLWREPIQTSRCVIVATAFAESNGEGKDKRTYLLESGSAFLLGGIYRYTQTPGGTVLSVAVITCPPHPRLRRFHEKSTPFFLPQDQQWITDWLAPGKPLTAEMWQWLETPRLTRSFKVTPVYSTKRLDPVGEASEWLDQDSQAR